MIVSCRVKDYHDFGEKFELPGAVRLSKLTKAQIKLYLKEAGAGELWSLLESELELLEVVGNPLLLKLFTEAYGKKEDRFHETEGLSPAEVRDTIFDEYIKSRYEREEQKSKRLHQSLPFSLDRTETVLQKLAAGDLAQYQPSGGVKWQELDDLMGPDEDWQDFVGLATRMHVLLPVNEQRAVYRFTHLLLRDFLAFSGAKQAIFGGHDITRMSAVDVLGKLITTDPRAFEELGNALTTLRHDEYPHIRKQIVHEMAQLGPFNVRDVFVSGFRTSHSIPKHEAVSFKWSPSGKTLDSLREALEDPDKDIQFSAAAVLARYGDERSVALLCEITAARLADTIGDPIEASFRRARRRCVRPLSDFMFAISNVRVEATGCLIDMLNGQEGQVRARLAILLAALGRFDGINALIEELGASESHMRVYAASVLSMAFSLQVLQTNPAALELKRNPALSNTLGRLLKDEDSRVRLSVAIMLNFLGESRAGATLVNLLKDGDAGVRKSAVEVLGGSKDQSLLEEFLVLLNDEDSEVREEVAWQLGNLGDPRAVVALIPLLKDESVQMRRAAMLSLGLIEDPRSLEPIIDAVATRSGLLENHAYEVCRVFDLFGNLAVDALDAFQASGSITQRLKIVRVLGRLENKRAVDVLINLVDDPQEEVSLAALHEILDTAVGADGCVERRLEGLRTSASMQVRLEALCALAKVKGLKGDLDPLLVEEMLLLHQDPEMDTLPVARGKRLRLSHALEIMIDAVVPPRDELACFARTFRFLFTIRDYERAMARLTRAIDRTPCPPWYFYSWRSEIASDWIGQTDSSVLQDCEKAIRLRPEIGYLYCLQGRVQHRLGRFRAALKDLREADRLEHGRSVITAHWIGWTLYDLKDHRQALKSFSKAIGLRKDTVGDDHSGRGWAFFQLGHYRAAFKDFTVAKDVFGRRDLFELAGDYKRALAEADKIIEQSPNDAKSHQVRGLIHLKMNHSDQAARDLTTAVDLQPDNSLNYHWRALCHALAGNLDQALTDLERGPANCMDDPIARTYNTFWRGVIREKQGLKQEATDLYRHALDTARVLDGSADRVRSMALITLMYEPHAARGHYEDALKEKPLRHQHYTPLLSLHILMQLFPKRTHIRETWVWYQEKLGPTPIFAEAP